MQHPIVSVADILGRPGKHKDLEVCTVLAGVGGALARLREDPVEARLRAESVVEGILLTGSVTGTAAVACARCLAERSEAISVEVCELFGTDGRGAEEDAYPVSGTELDLEPMLRDAVALALPLKPVCREECKGLCARCGADLNAGECACAGDDVDPRWAGLAALRERLPG